MPTAAIKVFDLKFIGVFKGLEVEQVMRKIGHRNLVKIISSCSQLDFKALDGAWRGGCTITTIV